MPMAQRSSQARSDFEHSCDVEQTQESDHRIANNLQLLMAMIAAEKREVTDAAGSLALDRMLGRIGAIAGVHRQLCSSRESGTVQIGGYLQALGQQIEAGCCDIVGGRRVLVNADDIAVPARLAAAIGLIVSECVLNACKYAYPRAAAGDVRIELRRAGTNALRVSVEDDGVGRLIAVGAAGFGTRLIEMLAIRIGAVLLWEDTSPGTRLVLAVPLA